MKLTIHRTLNSLADIARTVTFHGGCAGGACNVSNSFVASEGSEGPTTFTAIKRSWYLVNGIKLWTVNAVASGFDSSYTENHEVFRAVWAWKFGNRNSNFANIFAYYQLTKRMRTSMTHRMIDEFPSKPGVNCTTTEKATILVTANFVGGWGRTGSTPDWIVATREGPRPMRVQAKRSNL